MKENDFPGNFIVLEGADGSGTTTQARRLVEELDAYYTAEHTERIHGREFLIGKKVEEMISSGDYSPESIALGFAADRMVHLEEEIIPRLEQGKTVVFDRYYHSSLVYQPALGAEYSWVKEINRAAVKPDLTVILDISADTGMERLDNRGKDGNIFESLGFQEEVVARYRKLPEKLEEKITLIDGTATVEKVAETIRSEVKTELNL